MCHERLTTHLHRLLDMMPGPDFTAQAVAALADLPTPHAAADLSELVDATLLGKEDDHCQHC
ncbi:MULTISPECIES: hypothetical protein [unclassified Nocardiopsis]|uniref:hypothetical protein n=1 Tax=unclassified Nocardiopsis TaxID=2649073 RepID=UPI00135B4DBB|nr:MULTISPECIES: hypothetical protein [unclassified Nocardiopsis]